MFLKNNKILTVQMNIEQPRKMPLNSGKLRRLEPVSSIRNSGLANDSKKMFQQTISQFQGFNILIYHVFSSN